MVETSAHGAFVASLRDWVSQIAPPFLWRQVYPPHPLFHCILPGYLRLDLTVTTRERVTVAQDGIRALYDPFLLWDSLPSALPGRSPDPARIAYFAEEFLRIQGLLPLSVGRNEPVVGVSGVNLLRGLLIDLMIEAQAPPVPPGALSLARVLPPEDIAVLACLPGVTADSPSVIAASLGIARVFLPRARALAMEIGATWPDSLEAEVQAQLKRTLRVDLPPSA